MAPVLGLVAFGLVFMVFARIVFACVPAFRPTALNTLIFVSGSFVGAVAALFVDNRFHPTRYMGDSMLFFIPLLGGPICGTLAVWIKTRLYRPRAF
jgi:hypothetical protein